MAQRKNATGLTELLLKCMAEPDPCSAAGMALRSVDGGGGFRPCRSGEECA